MMNKKQKIELLQVEARALGDDEWEVPSLTSSKKYKVIWHGTGGTCECEGFKFRKWCIHLDVVQKIAPTKPREEEEILDELWT